MGGSRSRRGEACEACCGVEGMRMQMRAHPSGVRVRGTKLIVVQKKAQSAQRREDKGGWIQGRTEGVDKTRDTRLPANALLCLFV
ncbi:hypothetical protein K438DRAFT_1880261 [Mycena galopus ATCC 62051]|nr:hypothetical protein K438DRAFT_1880261 [Mycena galopus ATCC 62051]